MGSDDSNLGEAKAITRQNFAGEPKASTTMASVRAVALGRTCCGRSSATQVNAAAARLEAAPCCL